MNSTSQLTLPHIEAALTASGLPFEVWPCDAALADTAAFCAHYGVPPENSVNAILVRSKTDPEKMALCMVPATQPARRQPHRPQAPWREEGVLRAA